MNIFVGRRGSERGGTYHRGCGDHAAHGGNYDNKSTNLHGGEGDEAAGEERGWSTGAGGCCPLSDGRNFISQRFGHVTWELRFAVPGWVPGRTTASAVGMPKTSTRRPAGHRLMRPGSAPPLPFRTLSLIVRRAVSGGGCSKRVAHFAVGGQEKQGVIQARDEPCGELREKMRSNPDRGFNLAILSTPKHIQALFAGAHVSASPRRRSRVCLESSQTAMKGVEESCTWFERRGMDRNALSPETVARLIASDLRSICQGRISELRQPASPRVSCMSYANIRRDSHKVK
jgi:hypothetical protein